MGRLSNVQVLRAFAAVLVIVSHALHETNGMASSLGLSPLNPVVRPWAAAVDIFFVMSGFILVAISYEQFGSLTSSREFFLRRLVRAVPLYWLLTTLMLVVAAVAPTMLNVPIEDTRQILASYLFWPYPRGEGELRPVLALGWTMNLEFFFYSVLALCLAFSRRLALMLLGATLIGIVALQQSCGFSAHSMVFYGDAMTLDFVIGMAIAIAYRRGVQVPAPLSLLALAMSLTAIATAQQTEAFWPKLLTLSLPAGLLVAGAVFGPQLGNGRAWQRGLILLGDACYSIYLLQPFLLRPAARIWTLVIGGGLSLWAFVAAGTVAVLALGTVAFRVFEHPLTGVLNRRLRAWEQGQPRRVVVVPAE